MDEGGETDVKNFALLGILVLEVGEHSVVLDRDGAHFLAPCYCLLQLVCVDRPLVHTII